MRGLLFGLKRSAGPVKTRQHSLRTQLIAATLGCVVLTSGTAGFFFLYSLARESKAAALKEMTRSIEVMGRLVTSWKGENAAHLKELFHSLPAVYSCSVLMPDGSEALAYSKDVEPKPKVFWINVPLKDGGLAKCEIRASSLPQILGKYSFGLFLSGLFTLLLFLVCIWFALTLIVVRPLKALSEQAGRLTKGEVVTRLKETGSREIASLCAAMNTLGSALLEKERSAKAQFMAVKFAFHQLRMVVDSLSDGVMVGDRDLDVTLINPEAQKILRTGCEEIVGGSSLLACFPLKARKKMWPMLDKFRKGVTKRVRTEIPVKGKRIRISMAPLLGGDEKMDFMGVVLVLHDASREQELEEMKDTLISSVSHELRTPLTSIKAYTEILEEMPPSDDETRREFLGIIGKEVDRLNGIVQDLLEFSSLRGGKELSLSGKFSVQELYDSSKARFQAEVNDAGIALSFTGSLDKLPDMQGDRERIQQVLDQLLSNAMKFTPKGGKITVSVRLVRDHGERLPSESVEISVVDTGPGVPPEKREAIFDRFTQLGELMEDKPKGVGLGLPLASSIIRAHGGRIWCENNPSGGAWFSFTIPLSPRPREHKGDLLEGREKIFISRGPAS